MYYLALNYFRIKRIIKLPFKKLIYSNYNTTTTTTTMTPSSSSNSIGIFQLWDLIEWVKEGQI